MIERGLADIRCPSRRLSTTKWRIGFGSGAGNLDAEAQVWMRDIYDFVAAGDATAAERVVARIHASAQSLRKHPRLGERYTHIEDREIRVWSTATIESPT